MTPSQRTELERKAKAARDALEREDGHDDLIAFSAETSPSTILSLLSALTEAEGRVEALRQRERALCSDQQRQLDVLEVRATIAEAACAALDGQVATARNAALEEAADIAHGPHELGTSSFEIADRIRALSSPAPEARSQPEAEKDWEAATPGERVAAYNTALDLIRTIGPGSLPSVGQPEAEVAEIEKRHSQDCLNEVAATTMDCADDWSRDMGSQAHQDRATLLRLLRSRAPWVDRDAAARFIKQRTGGAYGMEIIEGMEASGILNAMPTREEIDAVVYEAFARADGGLVDSTSMVDAILALSDAKP